MEVQRQRLTAAEVAAMLGISLPRLYALAAQGFVPARKIGRAWYFLKPEIEAWLRGEHPAAGGNKSAAQ